jgi:2-iminobutanoate/2-iminopropanoate deaminase
MERIQPRVIAIAASLIGVALAGIVLWGEPGKAQTADKPLQIEHINPLPSMGFTQVVVTRIHGVKTIYVSGQVGRGDDMETQSTVAFEGLKTQLEAAGASPADVVKLNTYIKEYTPADIEGYSAGKAKVFGGLENQPASTLVGVQSLVSPQFRIEVEAIAVVAE